jgi:hypothetical protein
MKSFVTSNKSKRSSASKDEAIEPEFLHDILEPIPHKYIDHIMRTADVS